MILGLLGYILVITGETSGSLESPGPGETVVPTPSCGLLFPGHKCRLQD